MVISLPFPVYGTVSDSGTAVGSGVTVRLRNERTNQVLTVQTASDGKYAFDGANFSQGYDSTDTFTVYVIYSNLEDTESFTVVSNTHEVDLALTSVADSSLIYYTTVQNVWDELDGISSSDISAARIIKAVQRAENYVDERAETSFRSVTYTQEEYDFNQYNTKKSAEQLAFISPTQRRDSNFLSFNDMIRLDNYPVLSITTLQRNSAGEISTDSWTTLTEQTGTSGDFIVDKNTGWVKFMQNVPRYGKRSLRVTYTAGYTTVPKRVERLATMLAVKDVLLSKIGRSIFDTVDNVTLEAISITKGTSSASDYIRFYTDEVEKAFEAMGDFDTHIV